MTARKLLRRTAEAVGTIVLLGLAALLIRFDYVAAFAANRILANAIAPTDREPPPTPGAIPYSSADIQVIGGRGEGLSCSLPPVLELLAFRGKGTPIGLKMHQACAFHDYCYRHGAATYGYTQADCDFLLQEHAFRLCRFTDPEASNEQCRTNARLITLGVRAGGSDSFRSVGAEEDDRASTYFEFDNYPTRSGRFDAYRVADARGAGIGPARKALYRFRIRPSGISIHVSRELGPFEHHGEVPGSERYMVNAPIVVTEQSTGQAVDWFVWWQRYDMEGSGGRLVAFSPSSATRDDLECLARPSELGDPSSCFVRSPSVVAALVGKRNEDDPGFTEIVAADKAGEWPRKGLSLMALRVHSCVEGGKSNALCIVHALVDPSEQAVFQQQEPLTVRDRLTVTDGQSRRESMRYQNFAMLPFVASEDTSGEPVLIWAKREKTGEASFRRAGVNRGALAENTDDTSVPRGTVRLIDFAESDEPAFVIDRAANGTVAASLVASGARVMVRLWHLPPTQSEPNVAPTVEADEQACSPDLDRTWLARPPQFIREADQAALVFSRIVPGNGGRLALEIAVVRIDRGGACSRSSETVRTPDLPEKLQRSDLRKLPLVVGRLAADDALDVVLPADPPILLCSLRTEGCTVPSTPLP